MKLTYDPELDIAAVLLVDEIPDGGIAQDIGPQLTPNRQSVTMSYDDAGCLVRIEFWAGSRVLQPDTLGSGALRLTYDSGPDVARLHFVGGPVDDGELLVVGPQLTPTADRLLLAYDTADHLVYIEVEGADRVLRAETLAAAS